MAGQITLHFDGIDDVVINIANDKLEEVAVPYGTRSEDFETNAEALADFQYNLKRHLVRPYQQYVNRQRESVDITDAITES